jgi:hypothetical protein
MILREEGLLRSAVAFCKAATATRGCQSARSGGLYEDLPGDLLHQRARQTPLVDIDIHRDQRALAGRLRRIMAGALEHE